VCEVAGAGDGIVAGKGPHDTGGGGEGGDVGEDREGEDDGNHGSGAAGGTGGLGEYLDERKAGSAVESGVDVANAEEDRDKHAEAEGAVDADAGEEGVGDDRRGVFDLLAHVDGAVGAEEGEDGCDETNEEGRALPIAAEGEVDGEDVSGGTMRGEVGQGNENAEEAEDVQDEGCAFELGKLGCEVGVDEEGEESDGEEQEGTMPSLEAVGWVVEDEEALDDGATEVSGTGETGLPGQDGLPTW
jgi:hypothetical protein